LVVLDVTVCAADLVTKKRASFLVTVGALLVAQIVRTMW
jgi:hypothetical protein